MVVTETQNNHPHSKKDELLVLIGLSKSTYYDWVSSRKPIDRYFSYDLLEAIRICFKDCGRSTYGSKRIAKCLKRHGKYVVSAKKVLKYMKKDCLVPNNYAPPRQDKLEKPERQGKYPRILKSGMAEKELAKYPLILSGDITEE